MDTKVFLRQGDPGASLEKSCFPLVPLLYGHSFIDFLRGAVSNAVPSMLETLRLVESDLERLGIVSQKIVTMEIQRYRRLISNLQSIKFRHDTNRTTSIWIGRLG